METNEKQKELQKITPHIWNMYVHIFDERKKLENKLNYFLAINTLFLLGYYQMFQAEITAHDFQYITPFLFLLFPILILLVNFFSMSLRIPWIERNDLKIYASDNAIHENFFKEWLIEIINCAESTESYKLKIRKLLRLCLGSLWFAIFLMLLIYINYFCQLNEPKITDIIIMIVIICGVFSLVSLVYINLKGYPYKEKKYEIRNEIEKWVINNK